jgi:hypothetical protein
VALMRVYCGLAATQPASTDGSAAEWLTVSVVDDAGRLLDVCDIADDPTGYAQLGALLAERSGGANTVAVAADSDEHQVTLLIAAAGGPLAIVDEEILADYAERFADDESADEISASPAERNAVGLARALQAGALAAEGQGAPRELVALKPVLAAHASVAAGRHSTAVALREVLRELYPAALRAYPDPAEPIPLAILDALPEPGLAGAAAANHDRDANVAMELAATGVADAGTITEAITALRVAISETPRRTGIGKGYTAAVTETIRQAVAAVRACDAATVALVGLLIEKMPQRQTPLRGLPPRAATGPQAPAEAARPEPVRADSEPSRTESTRAGRRRAAATIQPVSPAPARTTPPRSSRATRPAAAGATETQPSFGGQPRFNGTASAPPAATPASAPPFTPSAPAAAAPPFAPAPATPPFAPAPAAPVAPVYTNGSYNGSDPQFAGRFAPPSEHNTAAQEPQAYEPRAYQTNGYQPKAYEPRGYESPGYEPQGFEPQSFERRSFEPRGFEPRTNGMPAEDGQPDYGARSYLPPARAPQPATPAIPPAAHVVNSSPQQPPDAPQQSYQLSQPAAAHAQPPSWDSPSVYGAFASNASPASGPVGAHRQANDEYDPAYPLAPEITAPGSRDTWPINPPDFDELARVDSSIPRQRDGRVAPPWMTDLEEPEPPALHLVEPEPAPVAGSHLRLITNNDAPSRSRSERTATARAAAPAEADEPPDDDLLIFAQMASAWFTDPSEDSELTWSDQSADEGWSAALRAADPSFGEETSVGLPRRVPQANLVPGSPLPPAPERALRIVRDAASIAAHTTGYFRGSRRGEEVRGYSVGGRPGRESAGGWDFSRDNWEDDRDTAFRSAAHR